MKWWVDAPFAAHPYCKGNTGTMMSTGSVSIMELPWKKKINRRSSTKSEIVEEENDLPQCLWSRYFIVDDIESHQDNMISIIIENNWKD